MITHRIVLFNTSNLTVSNPFEITGEQLKKLKEYCYDTDYRYTFEEASIMCQDEVDETLKAADQFWEDIQ